MTPQKFCSQCGKKLDVSRKLGWAPRILCPDCSSGSIRPALLIVFIALALFAAGFAVAHLLKPRDTVYLIGTPLEKYTADAQAHSQRSDSNRDDGRSASTAPSTDASNESVCGAPTRSGKACRRKVKGGGYCWQHRDKQPVNSIGPTQKRSTAPGL